MLTMPTLPAIFLAVGGLLLTGCSSLHLYDKSKDEAATAAKADFEASKLGERIKAQRTILLELEERDVAAFRKVTNAKRDNDLISLVIASEEKQPDGTDLPLSVKQGFAARFLAYTKTRLDSIQGEKMDLDVIKEAASKADAEQTRAAGAQKLPRNDLNFSMKGLGDLPACGVELAKLKDAKDGELLAGMVAEPLAKHARELWPSLRGKVNLLGEECSKELAARRVHETADAAPSSLLGKAIADHRTRLDDSEETAVNAVRAKAALKKAAEELAAASKELGAYEKQRSFTCPETNEDEPTLKDPPETRLCTVLAQLDKMGGVGREIIAEEKIERISHVLQALSGIESPAGDDKVDKALALIAATTRLGHALQQYQHADQWPALESLIIEKQLAEAQLTASKARVELGQARLRYSAEQVAALRLEVKLLDQAAAQLGNGYGGLDNLHRLVEKTGCVGQNVHLCKSYEDLLNTEWKGGGPPPERHAYRAMALLSQSHSTARDRYQTASLRLALSRYQESLILSEEALAMWHAILVTPVDLLRQYHEGGLKPETVAPLLQTIGIFGIAARVK